MTETQEPPEEPAELEPHIAAFLLHRIDEDEKTAQVFIDETTLPAAWMALHELTDPPASIRRAFKHAIRHDPARIVTERSAKRRIVLLHEVITVPVTGRRACSECNGDFPCKTLRLLALPYDDYPGYDQGWAL